MLERSDIEFPIWRKKVDATLLKDGETPIPKWLWDVWSIEQIFGHVTTKKDDDSHVKVLINNNVYSGNVTKVKKPNGYGFKLSVSNELTDTLDDIYLMSYMRMLEYSLQTDKTYHQVEEDISFWEFIDIEFDASSKQFLLKAHYTIKPQFPMLFERLIKSAPLKSVSDSILEKETGRIHKQNWQPREQYKLEIGATNVVYMLLDSQKKLLYVGEATDLIKRFDNGHPDIREWDYYKYNVLPAELAPFRVTIERMTIRDMACLLTNKQDIPNIVISEYKLANRKIDK